MIDLLPDHLTIVKDILLSYVPEVEVRIFGSRVTGNAQRYSDLDLVIVGGKKIDRKVLYRLEEAFEESDLPFRVDVLDWHRISEEFRKVIEEEYKIIPT